jgi:hypothetical protein
MYCTVGIVLYWTGKPGLRGGHWRWAREQPGTVRPGLACFLVSIFESRFERAVQDVNLRQDGTVCSGRHRHRGDRGLVLQYCTVQSSTVSTDSTGLSCIEARAWTRAQESGDLKGEGRLACPGSGSCSTTYLRTRSEQDKSEKCTSLSVVFFLPKSPDQHESDLLAVMGPSHSSG